MVDINVPNVGESVSEVTIATWFKKVGDFVKKDETIVELETDKAAQELVSPQDGVLTEIIVSEGENAVIGALIARLDEADGAAPAASDSAPKEKAAPAAAPAPAPATSTGGIVMPSASRVIAENGLDTSSIAGTGKDLSLIHI